MGVPGRVHGRAHRGFNTLVLLTSSLFAVTAHHYAEKGEGVKAANWLMMTVLGGAIFAGIKFGIEWPTDIREGNTLTSHPFWSFYYVAAACTRAT
jgi:heme/copper-type cytochrome/quinol oxidase subunit 3